MSNTNFTSVSEREKIDNNSDRTNDEPSESVPLFTDVNFIPKKEDYRGFQKMMSQIAAHLVESTTQKSSTHNVGCDTDCEWNKSIPEKRFVDVAVMTEQELEIRRVEDLNENIRISNLMFCKFISHELEQHTGKKCYNIMQKIIEALQNND